MKNLIQIFFLLLPQFCFAQLLCVDSTYRESIFIENKSVDAAYRISTSEGGTILKILQSAPGISSEFCVTKLMENGNPEWGKFYIPINSNQQFFLHEILEQPNGGFVIGGRINYKDASLPAFLVLIKIDASGNTQWIKKYRNTYGATPNDDVWLINLKKGYNGDILMMTEVNQTRTITLLDVNGIIKWSNQYFSVSGGNEFIFFHRSMHIEPNGSSINLWQIVADSVNACFRYGESLSWLSLDYATGNIQNTKRFCIAPGMIPVSINELSQGAEPFFVEKLINGKTLVIIKHYDSQKNLFIMLFDRQMNFEKSILFDIPNVDPNLYPNYSFDVNPANTELSLSITLYISNQPYYFPYNFLYMLDSNLDLKNEIFVQNTLGDTLFSNIKYLQNGNLNVLSSSRISAFSPYYQIDYTSIISGAAKEAFCNAKDTVWGTFQPHGLVYSGNDFRFDSIRRNEYINDGNFTLAESSINLLQNKTCVKISTCSTLTIKGDTSVCLSTANNLRYSAEKNNGCLKNIHWQIDNSFASIIRINGDSVIQLNFRREGSAALYAILEGCGIIDSLRITAGYNKNDLSINGEEICPGRTATLSATPGFREYFWNTGETTASISSSSPGLYKVTATDNCGNKFSDSTWQKYVDTSLHTGYLQELCVYDTFALPINARISTITWSPVEKASLHGNILKFFPTNTQEFNLVANYGDSCYFEKNIYFNVTNCPETVHFPSAFTPNDDNRNDLFRPVTARPFNQFFLQVYNRYGQLIFTTQDPYHGWDGKLNGMTQETGAYVWICRYRFNNRPMKFLKGTVLLLH